MGGDASTEPGQKDQTVDDAYVSKPFDVHRIVELIEELTATRR